jgi:GTP cyclohydrolase I
MGDEMKDSRKKLTDSKRSGQEHDPLLKVVQQLLAALDEDPRREGLQETPERLARSLRFLTSGYRMRVSDVVKNALYTVAYDEMVIVKDIEVFSMCEHHLLPFFGRCHVAYLPNKRVIGLSKIPRIVDMFARRLQIQERLTHQIAMTIQESIRPQGVGVVIEAKHLCMMMRGVEKQHSQAITSTMLGAFRTQQQTREEFLSLVLGTPRT